MEMEARCLGVAERILDRKPNWLNFLPENPADIAMTYVPFSSNPTKDYSVRLLKPAFTIPGDAETTEEMIVFGKEIEAAASWLDNAYRFIDRHDDEGRSLRLPGVQVVIADVDSARTRSSSVLTFADSEYKKQRDQLAKEQS